MYLTRRSAQDDRLHAQLRFGATATEHIRGDRGWAVEVVGAAGGRHEPEGVFTVVEVGDGYGKEPLVVRDDIAEELPVDGDVDTRAGERLTAHREPRVGRGEADTGRV